MSFSSPKKSNRGAWVKLGLILAFLLFVTCVCGRFASENTANNLLQTSGFTNIRLVDRDPYFVGFKGCGKGDLAIFTYEATNPVGKNVNVSVCQGWPFKGATIRSL